MEEKIIKQVKHDLMGECEHTIERKSRLRGMEGY